MFVSIIVSFYLVYSQQSVDQLYFKLLCEFLKTCIRFLPMWVFLIDHRIGCEILASEIEVKSGKIKPDIFLKLNGNVTKKCWHCPWILKFIYLVSQINSKNKINEKPEFFRKLYDFMKKILQSSSLDFGTFTTLSQ